MVNTTDNLAQDLASGLVKESVFIADNASLALKRSVISGFSPAVILDDEIKLDNTNLKRIKLEQMYFNNCKGNIFVENSSNNEDLEDYYGNPQFSNLYEHTPNQEMFIDIKAKTPDFRVKIGKITASK